MRSWVYRGVILAIAGFLLVISGCSKSEKYPLGESGGTLTIGMLSEPSSLNPLRLSFTASTDIHEKLFLNLHRFDKDMNIVAGLARSWKFSEDFKEVTYYLRKDVKWSDGQPVTAEDVKFTFDMMRDPQLKYARVGGLQFVEKVEVVNPQAVKFFFNRVYSDELFDTGIMVLPKHILETLSAANSNEFDVNPVSDGPYKVEEWVRGDRLVLAANPDFYKGKPALDRIVFKFFGDEASLMAALQNGTVDMTNDLSPQYALKVQGDQNLVSLEYPGQTFTFIGWNLKSPLFSDLDLRKAFALGIDQASLINDVLMGKGKPATGPFLPTSWAYDQNLKPQIYDPEQAKTLLAEMGWKTKNRDGYLAKGPRQVLELNLLLAQGQPVQEATAVIIREQLKGIGVNVNLVVVDARTFIQRLRNGQYDAMLFSWKNDFKVDPTAVWHSAPEKGIYNFILKYSNPSIDSLIDRGLATLSRRKAKDIWVKFQQEITTEMPATYLYVPDVVTIIYKGVKGPAQDARGPLASLDEWWIPAAERRGEALASASSTPAEVVPPPPSQPEEAVTPERRQPEKPIPTPTTAPTKPQPIATRTEQPAAKPTTAPVTPPKPAAVNPQDLLVAEATPTPAATSTPAVEETPQEPEIPPTEPEATKIVSPAYPENARKAGITGRVFVKILVGTDGKVKDAQVIRGIGYGCDEAAVDAAMKAQFKPGTKNGKPADSYITIPYPFMK
jgi:peptide/nickel transport system substrate-binding protein